jgi:hypothetical protein
MVALAEKLYQFKKIEANNTNVVIIKIFVGPNLISKNLVPLTTGYFSPNSSFK